MPIDPSTLLYKLASAIATAEGFFVSNSLPARNNNPGDLRAAPWLPTAKIEGGFWVAPTREAGIAGLYHQIALDIARGASLRALIYKWAPPTENNTSNYLNETARRVGVDPTDFDKPLWTFLNVEKAA